MGVVRDSNQDAYEEMVLDGNIGAAIVCDGMGGVKGGNIASNMAARFISEKIKNELNESASELQIKELVFDAVKEANYLIYRESQKDFKLTGMGTTCVICIVKANKAHIINAGDSRAYHISDNNIFKITRDHSIVQDLIDSGKISDSEAKSHPQKNIITRALGTEKEINLDYFEIDYNSGFILLCTDGLTNYLEDNELKDIILNSNNIDKACEKMIKTANQRGGSDNITVVIISDN